MQLYADIGFIPRHLYEIVDVLCKDIVGDLTDECIAAIDATEPYLDGTNIYDVYRICYDNDNDLGKLGFWEKHRLATRMSLSSKSSVRKEKLKAFAPPCVDSKGIDELFGNATVKKAISVPDDIEYSMCNDDADFNYDTNVTGSYWAYQ